MMTLCYRRAGSLKLAMELKAEAEEIAGHGGEEEESGGGAAAGNNKPGNRRKISKTGSLDASNSGQGSAVLTTTTASASDAANR